MKKTISRILVAVMILSAFCLTACKKAEGLDAVGKHLTTYKIEAVYDDAAKKVDASAEVDFINPYNVELSELKFHLYPAAYREGAALSPISARDEAAAYPNGKNYGTFSVTGVSVAGKETEVRIEGTDADILTVPLPEPLMPTYKQKVTIRWTATLPNVRHRYGWYNDVVNLGNFYPVACVYENGEFVDDPYYANGDPFYSELANYEVKITAPENFIVATSGPASASAANGSVTVTSSVKAVRDFAVVMSPNFKTEQIQAGNTAVTYYYVEDTDPAVAARAAADSLATFGEMFGPYPYGTLSVVKTPFLQGGMEYPGLIYISDDVKGELFKEVVVHETAHQWWYGMVGSNEVAYAWMDEGLTEYSTSLFYEKNPSYNVDFNSRIGDALSAYMLYCDVYKDNGKGDTSMNRPVHEYADAFEYTYMTYVKGQLMFDSLRKTIGDEAFFAGLKRYFEENKFKNAKPANLVGAFEKASGHELMGFFDSWTEGKVKLYGGFD